MEATRAHRGLSHRACRACVSRGCSPAPRKASAPMRSRETLGKSVSTAYNLLASLCDEGVAERHPGGLYRLSQNFRDTVAEESDRHDLSGVVDDLLARTHKRAYLAVLRNNQLRVVLERGLQGMPKLPGMNPEIADNAHALALGKVVLALGPREAVERYALRRPQTLHPDDHHRPARSCMDELRHRPPHGRRVRTRGVRTRLLLPRRARARPRAPVPRRRGHQHVAQGVRLRARAPRRDPP